jgi:CubicO group peptidase (beta-lactamase class C family)
MTHPTSRLSKCLPRPWLFLFIVLLLSACTAREVPADRDLPRSTPEEEGVSSASIAEFLDAVEESGQELHGFVYLRNGKLIAEGWWDPYSPELKHTLYSTSKSFTSTAIGFAVTEGLLTVDDRVVSFFPDQLPDSVSAYLASMKVKHLLTMAAGQDPPQDLRNVRPDQDWVTAFLAYPVAKEPGSEFKYNSMATYMLSAIVTKVTGQAMLEYLEPKFFVPLQIEDKDWETDPEGIINSGGWGLRLKTGDMARFGQLYLQKGEWNGRQLLPAEWIEEATSKHIDQKPWLTEEEREVDDWAQGYGYKFWRSRYHSFRADGAFGQLIMVLPEEHAVIAVNAEVGDMQKELNTVWEYLLPGMHDGALEADPEAREALQEKLENLSLKVPGTGSNDSLQQAINNSTYEFEPAAGNEMASCSFSFDQGVCQVTFTDSTGKGYAVVLGAGEWVTGEIMLPGPNLVPFYEANASVLLPAKIAAAYSWQGGDALELTVRYIESPHTVHYTFRFNGEMVSMKKEASMGLYRDLPEVEGKRML